MIGFRFKQFIPEQNTGSPFDRLLKLFLELLVHTSGDIDEAFDWMKELDDEYELTDADYSLDDFRKDLEDKGYLNRDLKENRLSVSSKAENLMRKNVLNDIFGKLKKGNKGEHKTTSFGTSNEATSDRRPYKFGDRLDRIDFNSSIRNAQVNNGIDHFFLTENDLEIEENEHTSQTSTVLMIDISHSMILYGEDRITPAKKVAMALSELITRRFPKDTIDIVVFGNDAWQVSIKDLPYLTVGPYHTNTVAGLELAMDILRRKKVTNKQIFMITDGKPTCIKEHGDYYQNSFGHDPKIINKTINLALQCRKLKIHITTFMIAQDPYLQKFVEEFTEVNRGKAFYSNLEGLGDFIFSDYKRNKRNNNR